jgi:hypothetical protein
VFSILQDSDSD